MPAVIGIDIGTFESKGVLVDFSGRIVARAVRAHDILTPRPGHVEHDAERTWWGDFCELARELTEAAGTLDIEAICCSGIGPCVLPIDRDGRPLRPAILYGVDTRAEAQIERLYARLGLSEVFARCGNGLSSQSAGPKIAWIRDNEPDVAARAERYVTCQSFLVGRLTGRWVIDHATAAYFHPLYDLAERRWRNDGVEDIATEQELPELAWAGEIAGRVTAAAAAVTGLPVGAAVLVGSSDALVEALSAGVARAGELMAMYGSSHFFIEVLSEPRPTPGLYSAPYLFPGTSVLAAGTSTAGTVTRWFARLTGRDPSRPGVFAELAEEASGSSPGAGGLLALPHFSGERTPLDDPDLRGAIVGLSLTTSQADVYRALLEGIAFGVGEVFATYTAAGAAPVRVRAAGGGTRNGLWTQLISTVTGAAQEVVPDAGAAFGDAMLAALAVGAVENVDDVLRWVTVAETIHPDATLHPFYLDRARLWSRLQSAVTPVMHALSSEGR